MKRAVVLLLIFVLVMPSLAFASVEMEQKLGNHWSKNEINRDFLIYYFPYLAKENFNRLSPNDSFYEDEFLLSFSSLLKNKGYTRTQVGWKMKLTRIEMAQILGEKLLEINAIESSDGTTPFDDIGDVSVERKKALADLFHAGLINGQSKTKFNPYAHATQAEAIILLQRVNSLLEQMDKKENIEDEVVIPPAELEKPKESKEPEVVEIPFTLGGIVQSYSGVEGIITKDEGEKLFVTITKSFSTSGYSMGIDKILKDKDDYKVYLNITPPSKESELLTVITYKTITIEIDKKHLGDTPYNFVWGNFFILNVNIMV
ncbi:protease complex subunit PrcB family protein [Clostridium sp. Cult2]|uniref:protease complex subunit PrcB family protein n=1 Tax=Clostridium sp. Cult2 TaxID=2079003 RepID=UPI001F40D301|nr:protease complex subunit PrcB family protein [Clostridium sp. Cult2]MCF6466192.1 hypothetical protein [Clostridium sp. Cult2]